MVGLSKPIRAPGPSAGRLIRGPRGRPASTRPGGKVAKSRRPSGGPLALTFGQRDRFRGTYPGPAIVPGGREGNVKVSGGFREDPDGLSPAGRPIDPGRRRVARAALGVLPSRGLTGAPIAA